MSTEQQERDVDLNQLLAVLRAAQQGDFAPRMDAGGSGVAAEIASAVNSLQEQNQLFASEVGRVAQEIRHKGMLGGQADMPNASGEWKMLVDDVNFATGQLCHQVRDMTRTLEAASRGEARKVTMPGEGEFALLRDALNSHLEQDRT